MRILYWILLLMASISIDIHSEKLNVLKGLMRHTSLIKHGAIKSEIKIFYQEDLKWLHVPSG